MMKMNARQFGNTRLAMLNKPRELATRAQFAEDIRRNWLNALEATVQVGRRLNEAKEKLPHGEYEAMVEQDLPFKPATARKLREVAAFVDSGKVPLEQLPEAYSTVYAIATMPEERRQEALEQGVIRPEVTRRELERFKEPLTIDVEAVLDSTDREPDPANDKSSPPTAADLMALPWYVDQDFLGTVLATGNGKTVLVIDPYREAGLDGTAVADLAKHITQLHNATLRAGR